MAPRQKKRRLIPNLPLRASLGIRFCESCHADEELQAKSRAGCKTRISFLPRESELQNRAKIGLDQLLFPLPLPLPSGWGIQRGGAAAPPFWPLGGPGARLERPRVSLRGCGGGSLFKRECPPQCPQRSWEWGMQIKSAPRQECIINTLLWQKMYDPTTCGGHALSPPKGGENFRKNVRKSEKTLFTTVDLCDMLAKHANVRKHAPRLRFTDFHRPKTQFRGEYY